jgi:oligoendopeptidase F
MTISYTIDPSDWTTIAPHYDVLLAERLTPASVFAWLKRWSDLQQQVWEGRAALKRDRARDLLNETAQQAYQRFVETVFAPFQVANEQLAAKLLALPIDHSTSERLPMLRYLRATTNIVSPTTTAIQSAIDAQTSAYSTHVAAMAVELHGQELMGAEVDRLRHDPNRAIREMLWRAQQRPWQHDRAFFDQLFLDLIAQRRQLAQAAGMPDYRAYRWRELGRIDYTPDDCLHFHAAIADELVPVVVRWQAARRQRLGVSTLRPWDVDGESEQRHTLQPFPTVEAFEAGMADIFQAIDPELGGLFTRMRAGFLDLGWRKGKLGGGEEWLFPVTGLPYVHLNADGTTEGIWSLLHEMGHAFHDYRTLTQQQLVWDTWYPDEFAECAAMALALLGGDFLSTERGGCYRPGDAARLVGDLLQHYLEWPTWGAMVDAFQHWVYVEAPVDVRPADLDTQWMELSQRFAPWIDWSGLEAEQAAGWHQLELVFRMPFYNIAYDLAELGAVQIWRNAQRDQPAAWRAFREALALGNTRSLPELFAIAGARLPFEPGTLRDLAETVDHALRNQPW